MTFQQAVAATPRLKNCFRAGLQALRAEDRPRVEAEDTRRLAGSVDVDAAWRQIDPRASRWDFAVAYRHSIPNREFVYWTEMHTASDSEVKVVIKKAQWLLNWLRNEGHHLARFEREIIWVSSGATKLNLTGYQQKQMATVGLRHIGAKLRIRNQR